LPFDRILNSKATATLPSGSGRMRRYSVASSLKPAPGDFASANHGTTKHSSVDGHRIENGCSSSSCFWPAFDQYSAANENGYSVTNCDTQGASRRAIADRIQVTCHATVIHGRVCRLWRQIVLNVPEPGRISIYHTANHTE
jgi:hypothetical protein